ncbi:cytochrome P450 81Q32-like [Rutidosis leptorrhynchoides]|uniref:cytochrome P450 81Q32-like n=1 Tax=Rutidosis leptorrhynchoides TaxID=125765 RepID=UPI003A99AB52
MINFVIYSYILHCVTVFCKNTSSHTYAMDGTQIFLLFVLFLNSLIIFLKLFVHKKKIHVAPSPPSIPIIGHLHLLNGSIHRVLQHLSSEYGPIMALKFGSRPVVVVTSPSLAEECFKQNDIVLANRPRLLSGKYFDYEYTSIGAVSYGRLWRDLRHVLTVELLSTTRLKSYMSIREHEVRSLIKSLYQDTSQDFTKVEMRSRTHGLSFNVLTTMIFNKRYFGTDVKNIKEANKFKSLIKDVCEISKATNPGDFITVLRWIDFQGYKKKVLKLQHEYDCFSQNLIDEIRNERTSCSSTKKGKDKTFIDTLLSMQESNQKCYTDNMIKGNIMRLLQAGTDTSSMTIEWAMSLLLNHPNVLKKARTELDKNIGQERLVQESDLPNLSYIQCIINETLRLFPTAPLLVPHEASEDCTIGGFDVAGGTMVLVNVWAIHRDPKLWDDPLSFRPERFEKMGKEEYRFIPYGMGRRQCLGSGLANRVMGLVLASLIQCFDWERVDKEFVDLSEGLTMSKEVPLVAKCKVRQAMSHVLMDL